MAMAGYTKLFGSILASTIWRAPDKTRIVWITLLAMADKSGIAEGSVPGLADLARVTIEDAEVALTELQSPDKYSRTADHEGRRIAVIEGVGWRILNHGVYREKMNDDERREYFRRKQAEHRERKKVSKKVKDGLSQSTKSTHTEAATDTQALGASAPKPQGDLFGDVKKAAKSGPETDPTTLRLFALFSRRPTTRLSDRERTAIKAASIAEQDLADVEAYYTSPHPEWEHGHDYRRRDLATLLNNWPGEVTRAGAWKAGQNGTRPGGATSHQPPRVHTHL